MNSNPLPKNKLFLLVLTRLIPSIIMLLAIFFLPAGTFAYWEAWVYLGIILIPMFMVLIYLLINDPALLERRMKMREKEKEQNIIIKISYFIFLSAFLLPGLDYRFGWSNVPTIVVIVADIIVLLGYGLFFLVLRENSYASRIIEVSEEQKVISSGPYAIVRHPMYLGAGLMYTLSPLALGSYWALIPGIFIIGILIARIISEESFLARDLPGYKDYMQKTKYRLVPGIW